MAFCRVKNGKVIEVWDVVELPPLTPELAAQYVPCDAATQEGWRDNGDGTFGPIPLTPADVAVAASSAKSRIKASMDESLATGFTCTNGATVNAGIQDVMLLFLALQKAERGNRPTLTFRDFNGTVQSNVTQSEVSQMLIEVGDNYEVAMSNKWAREAEIEAIVVDGVMTDAEKIAALNAIVW